MIQQGMWCAAKSTVRFTPEEEDALGRLKAASRNVPRWHLRRNLHWYVTAPLAVGYALMALELGTASAIVVPALSAVALVVVWATCRALPAQVLDVARDHPATIARIDCRRAGGELACLVTLVGMEQVTVALGGDAEHVYADLAERMVRGDRGPVSVQTHLADLSA